MAKLAPYLSKNAKNEDGIEKALAKDKNGPAHVIDPAKHTLTSTFTPSDSKAKATVLTYNWTEAGANSN